MTVSRLKALAAVLLLGSVALPQSTCAGYRAPDGKFVVQVPRSAPRGAYEPMVERHYAFTDFQPTDPGSWLKIGAFLWPLPLLVVAARTRSARLHAYISVAEPVLALGAGFVTWYSASIFATPAVGAYVAVGALAVYFVASAFDLWRGWRSPAAPVERRLTSA